MLTDEQIAAHMGWCADVMANLDRADFAWRLRTLIAVAEGAEREACAELCDDMVLYTGFDCAAKIRERSNVMWASQAQRARLVHSRSIGAVFPSGSSSQA